MKTLNSNSKSKHTQFCTYYGQFRMEFFFLLICWEAKALLHVFRLLIDLLRGQSSSLQWAPAVARPNKFYKKKTDGNSEAKVQAPQYVLLYAAKSKLKSGWTFTSDIDSCGALGALSTSEPAALLSLTSLPSFARYGPHRRVTAAKSDLKMKG